MRSFITFIYYLTAIMAVFLTAPKTAWAAAEDTLVSNVTKANALITDAIKTKDYNKYSQSRQILKEAEKITTTIKPLDKRAVAYMALAYSYARMRNEYTKSFFDSTKWTSKKQASNEKKTDNSEKDKKMAIKKSKGEISEDWTSIAEAYALIGKSVAVAAEIPSSRSSEVGDIYLLAAIGYEALREQTVAGTGTLDKNSLYNKALRHISKAIKAGSTFSKINEFGAYYQNMNLWSVTTLLSNNLIEETTNRLMKKSILSSNPTKASEVFLFENNTISTSK